MSNIEVSRQLSPAEVNWKTAQKIANTPFVPSAFRGKPEAVFAAILYGDELGLGPMQSLNSIHVIEGKPSMSPELMRALVARAGHRLDVKLASNEKVVLWGKRADNDSEATVEWSMKDAQQAGLAGRGAWKTYPRAMLLARATSEICRMIFSDCIAGLSYTPEESSSIAGVEWTDTPVDPLQNISAPVLTAAPPTTAPNAKPQQVIVEADWVEDPPYEPTIDWTEEFPGAEIQEAVVVQPAPSTMTNVATPKQIGMVRALIREWGLNAEEALSLASMQLGHEITTLGTLTKGDASSFITYLKDNHPGGVV
jgi:hypothetical protein